MMPLYEYRCQGCGANVELLIRSGDKPECPDCGSERLEKQFSVPAAHVASGTNLRIADQPWGGCGKPGCGPGGCAM